MVKRVILLLSYIFSMLLLIACQSSSYKKNVDFVKKGEVYRLMLLFNLFQTHLFRVGFDLRGWGT